MSLRSHVVRSVQWFLPRSVWSGLRKRRVNYAIKKYPRKIVRHHYGTETFNVEIADPLAEGWYDRDWPELPEIVELRRHKLTNGAKVFDLGAHQCVVAMMLARAVGPEGAVLALEANAHNSETGKRNLSLNSISNCEVVHGAVAAKSGQLTFTCGLNGRLDDGTGEYGKTEVTAYSIDELSTIHGKPDILFIDVEGMECMALAGGSLTLRSLPDCFVEVHVGTGLEACGGSVEEIVSLFPSESFDLLFRYEPDPHFVPLDRNLRPDSRFFLVAISRKDN